MKIKTQKDVRDAKKELLRLFKLLETGKGTEEDRKAYGRLRRAWLRAITKPIPLEVLKRNPLYKKYQPQN